MSGTIKKLHVASIGVNSILFVLVRLILKIMFVQSIKENIHVHIGKYCTHVCTSNLNTPDNWNEINTGIHYR